VARLKVIHAVEEGKISNAAPRLILLAGNAKRSLAERIAATKALRVLNDKSAAATFKDVLLNAPPPGPEGAAFHVEAFRTLAVLDPTGTEEAARAILKRQDPTLRSEAVQVLGTTADGAKFVGEVYLAKNLPKDMLPQVADNLRKHAEKHPELAQMLTDVMKTGLLLSADQTEIEKVRRLVATKGNPQRGRALYLNGKTLACITCHRMEGVGGNVGPDLTRLWETQSVEKIMESIIEPSKEIKEGFQMYKATTKKGLVYNGLKISQTPEEVVLRDATAKDIRIAAKDLEDLAVSKTSLMPEGVVAQLTYDQFIDLVAFLKDRSAQESLRGLVMEYHVVGPFPEDLKTAFPPEAKPDFTETYPKEKPGEVFAWQSFQARSDGYLNLREAFNQDHVSAYALTYVHSPQPQKVQMLLGADDTIRVWLNGTLVHEQAKPRRAKPDDERIEVTLNAGWNAVLLKVVNVEGESGLYLRFSGGEGIRSARKPEMP
jgi:putative heme-binding domain-containing protein